MTRHWFGAALISCVVAIAPGAVAQAQTLVLKGGSLTPHRMQRLFPMPSS